jgi:hypothetical protein
MRSLKRAAWFAVPALLLAAGVVEAQVVDPGVSLRVSREVAPSGVIAQMKVYITEPKPIFMGWASVDFGAYDDIVGIALDDAAAGIAVVGQGGRIQLSIYSPTAAFGTELDYPVLTVAGVIREGLPRGTRVPMSIDPASLRLVDSTGAVYPSEVKDGYLQAGGCIAISDVIPGSAHLLPGDVVTVKGSCFNRDTKLKIRELELQSARFVDANTMQIKVGQAINMHGQVLRARNKDGSEATYFSYQRIRGDGGSTDLSWNWNAVVPLFLDHTSMLHSLDVGETTAGLALQNQAADAAVVTARLVAADGTQLAAEYVTVPPNKYAVRSLAEIFGMAAPAGSTVTLEGPPVQALGIDLDALGVASPRLTK